MIERKLKISFNKGGNGSLCTRLAIPITWIRELGIDENDREVIVKLDDNKIIVEKSNK